MVELLVVIAIIGLLSTIVIVSFGSTRNQARDTTIKANMNQMRVEAELHYSNNANYMGANARADYSAAKTAANSASPGTLVEGMNVSAYCMSTPLAVNTSNSWCIDSVGNIGESTKVCNTTIFKCNANLAQRDFC